MAEYIDRLKLLSKAKNNYIEDAKNGYDYYDYILQDDLMSASTADVIEIPKNATNGDMIKAMFPMIEIYTVVTNEIVYVEICEDSSELRCSVDWWNAPYKRDSENE